MGPAVRRRLARLPDAATAVARSVAVLGPPTPLGDFVELTGLDRAVSEAAEALIAVGVLAADRDLDLDFVHPVVRSAVYGQIPPLERQACTRARRVDGRAAAAESERVAPPPAPAAGRDADAGSRRDAARRGPRTRRSATRGALDAAGRLSAPSALAEPPIAGPTTSSAPAERRITTTLGPG